MPLRRDELVRRLRRLARSMQDVAVELELFDRMDEWSDPSRGLAYASNMTQDVAMEVSESPELTIH